jgi:hypothetical protein
LEEVDRAEGETGEDDGKVADCCSERVKKRRSKAKRCEQDALKITGKGNANGLG